MKSLWSFALLMLFAFTSCGCSLWGGRGWAGSLHTESLGDDPVRLKGQFDSVYYTHSLKGDTSFLLANVSAEDLAHSQPTSAQFLHVQVLWLPKGGSTPMDSSATNASIRYVIIADGEVGIYSGAGFALPSGALDGKRASLTLRDATLQLQEATPGFKDILSPAQMSGSFTAIHDAAQTHHLRRAISQFVTNALGKTTLVMNSHHPD